MSVAVTFKDAVKGIKSLALDIYNDPITFYNSLSRKNKIIVASTCVLTSFYIILRAKSVYTCYSLRKQGYIPVDAVTQYV